MRLLFNAFYCDFLPPLLTLLEKEQPTRKLRKSAIMDDFDYFDSSPMSNYFSETVPLLSFQNPSINMDHALEGFDLEFSLSPRQSSARSLHSTRQPSSPSAKLDQPQNFIPEPTQPSAAESARPSATESARPAATLQQLRQHIKGVTEAFSNSEHPNYLAASIARDLESQHGLRPPESSD